MVIHTYQPREACDLVIRHLRAGESVVLPTEATYELVTSGLNECVAKADQAPAVVLGDYANLADWLPLLSGAGPRIFRKMGACPVTLRADGGYRNGHWQRLSEPMRSILVRDGILVRWPAHPIWDELRQANLPLVSIPLNATSADEAARLTNDTAACVIDDGVTQFAQAPTLVECAGRRCRVVREGVLTREQIAELALCRILFVCTGNTCRSPMAEVLCAKLLADRLGCTPADLREQGFCVQSAGLAAMPGGEASADAVRVVADIGADLGAHRSKPASMEMVLLADHIFAMTASHAYALASVPNLASLQLLSPWGDDVADPIGGALEDYRACADQIIQYLRERLPELLES